METTAAAVSGRRMSHAAPSMRAINRKPSLKRANSMKNATFAQKFLFARRLATFFGAAVYVAMCMQTTVQMVMSLNGVSRAASQYTFEDALSMRTWAGGSTLRQSPLVRLALRDQTTPLLNRTLFLQTPELWSLDSCPESTDSASTAAIYSHQFMSFLYDRLVAGAAYNITALNRTNSQLIAPVVDCSAVSILENDTTRGKFHFLLRSTADTDDVSLLTLALSVQEYWIPAETQEGFAAVASLTLINDLSQSDVQHHFVASLGYPFIDFSFQVLDFLSTDDSGYVWLQSVPQDPRRELSRTVKTSSRSGFYIGDATTRTNIKREFWRLETNPMDAIALWRWRSFPYARSNWAWVHLYDTAMGCLVLVHLIILCIVLHRTVQLGRPWAGDGTVSTAYAFLIRGVLLVVFWAASGFWEITEFCIHDAHSFAGLTENPSFTETMRLDVIHAFLSSAGYLGKLTKTRIDALFAFSCVFGSFLFRSFIVQISPALIATIRQLAVEFSLQERTSSSLSPMQLRQPYAMEQVPVSLILHIMIPVVCTWPLIPLYVVLNKAYSRLCSKPAKSSAAVVHRNTYSPTRTTTGSTAATTATTDSSQKGPTGDQALLYKSSFTNFELATGAHLENTYGAISDYDNYVFLKGMKFASADGIYASGFIIVNDRFLVQASDISSIVVMMITGVRFKYIYVFELKGTSVQQTAKLVYPNTFTVRDLLHLGISTLS